MFAAHDRKALKMLHEEKYLLLLILVTVIIVNKRVDEGDKEWKTRIHINNEIFLTSVTLSALLVIPNCLPK